MVHINQVELTNFKSFGGTRTIPLDEGFTVVTGPNGSGKSNILDGVLFCLGLATSRGMRADRLPDLVNSSLLKAGKSAETIVSVKFDLSDWQPDLAEEGLEPPEEGTWKYEEFAVVDEESVQLWSDPRLGEVLNVYPCRERGYEGKGVKVAVFDIEWFGEEFTPELAQARTHDCFVFA